MGTGRDAVQDVVDGSHPGPPPNARHREEYDVNTTDPTTDAPGTTRPPLKRPREGRILAGVAAGLADHLGLDVALVRLLTVVLVLITQGLGLLAYVAAAFLIPAAQPGEARPAAAARTGESLGGRPPLFWGGVALLVIGGWWLLSATSLRFGFLPGVSLGQVTGPLLLIGFGLALWVTGDRSSPATSALSSTASATSTTTRQESTMDAPTHTSQGPTGPATPPPAAGGPPAPPMPPEAPSSGEPAWTPPPAPERTRSPLGRATIGLMLVTVGLLWSLRLAGILAITAGQLLAAALLAIGLGLLVGAVVGRARGLIWFGVVLLPLVLISQVAEHTTIGGIPAMIVDGDSAGEVDLTPTSIEDISETYELGAGSLRLDLTEVPFDGETVTIEMSVGFGEVRVLVPDDVEVVATGSAGIGAVHLFERRASGLGVGELAVEADPDDPRGRVELEIRTGIGEIELDRRPAAIGAGS